MFDKFVFDNNGIPRYPYPSGLHYNIAFVCLYSLYHYSLHIKYKRAEDLDIFLKISDWIIDNGIESRDSFIFHYDYKFAGMNPPWISALGQGRMLSVLSRAYKITEQQIYLDLAIKTMTTFMNPYDNNGVQVSFPNGEIAFAEYPSLKPKIVLNGFITSIVGIYDLAEIGSYFTARNLFEKAISSLEHNLYRYDLGY